MESRLTARDGHRQNPLTKFEVEALLEALLGRPQRSLRDAHVELVMVDRQRTLLARVFGGKPGHLFAIDEVELLFDAIEEYGSCSIPRSLFTYGETDALEFAPPPLSAGEIQDVIALCALGQRLATDDLVVRINDGLIREQTRLRSLFVDSQAGARSRRLKASASQP